MKPDVTMRTRSKKLLAFLLVVIFSVTAALAQKQYTVKLLQPSAGQDIVKGQMYTVKFRITNTGTVAISMMDTIAIEVMIGMDMPYMGGTMYQLNPGDSVDMQINNFSYSNFQADAAASFCLIVEVFGNTHPNPSEKSSCENVNLKMSPTGIALQQSEVEVSVFPNPADGVLTLRTSEHMEGSLAIHDLSGRKISDTRVGGRETQISTSSFANGIYLYRLTDKSGGLVLSGRVAVQH